MILIASVVLSLWNSVFSVVGLLLGAMKVKITTAESTEFHRETATEAS